MAYFKKPDGSIAWLDKKDVAQWAKPDWMSITDQEAAELQKPSAEEEIKAAIAALEAKQTPRLMGDALLGNPDDVARLQNIRGQITALREELSGL